MKLNNLELILEKRKLAEIVKKRGMQYKEALYETE